MCEKCGNPLHANLYPDVKASFRQGVSTRPLNLAGTISFENSMQNHYMGGYLNKQETAPIFTASYNFRSGLDIGPLTEFDTYRNTITPSGGGIGGR